MATPSDEALYEKTKAEVDKIYDKPSAYRSMAYTRFYLKAYREKHGNDKNAYKGKKPGDLKKWRDEKWIDIRSYVDTPEKPKACGTIEYKKDEYPLCMPLRKAKSYSETELIALLNRKAELGKTRLVKEPYLRDLGVSEKEPEPKMEKEKPEKKRKVDLEPFKPPKEKKEKPIKEVPVESMVEKAKPEPKPEREPLPPVKERAWYKNRLQALKEERATNKLGRLEEKVKAGKYQRFPIGFDELGRQMVTYEPTPKKTQRRQARVSQLPPPRTRIVTQKDIEADPSLRPGQQIIELSFD